MNIKRFVIAAVSVFAFITIFDGVVHGVLLSPLYQAAPKVWRGNMDGSLGIMVWMTVYHAVFAVWTTLFFAFLFKQGGMRAGAQFGWVIGIFAGILSGASAIWLDVSPMLGISWFFASVVAGIGNGVLLGMLYRPATAPKLA